MDSDGSRILIFGIAAFVLVLLRGYYVACETAMTEINDAKVKSFENEKGRKKQLYNLLENPVRLMTSFSVWRILSAVSIAYFWFNAFSDPLALWINGLINPASGISTDGSPSGLAYGLSVALVIIATVLVITVLSERIPKRLAMKSRNGSFAVACVGTVKFLMVLLAPLTAVSTILTKVFLFLFGITGDDGKEIVTEEEIMLMVDACNETGELEESQKEMISNIFEFDDTPVSDIMTHRMDIDAVGITDKITDVVNLAISSGRSRIPVFEGTIDSILGFICVKDLLCLVGCESVEGFTIKNFLREMLYIPATNSCGEAFKLFTENKAQLAVVVDEYGGTAGLISMEDILESIVGNIQDEYDNEEEEISEISEGVYMVDGTAQPEFILGQLGVTLPEDHEYETVGGLVIDLLGKIPDENETATVRYKNIEFTVLVVEEKRIAKVKAVVLPEENSQ